jgi:hypothetical protein
MADQASNVVEFQPKTPLTYEQKLAMLRQAPPGALAGAYIGFRNERDAARQAEKDAISQMELIAGVIQEKLDELQQDGFTAGGQVVFRTTLETARVVDPGALRELILQDPEQNLQLVEMRANVDAVKNHMFRNQVIDDEGYDVTPFPDGVEIVEHRRLSVRKK